MYLNNKETVTVEKIFINAIIYTLDKKNTIFEAMGVSKGEIVFLGTNKEAINACDDNTTLIDLRHKTIVPGFIDAYAKIPERIIMRKDDLSLFECDTIKEYLDTIREYIDTHIDKEVIYGSGWNFNKFLNRDNFYKGPNKSLLNDICSDKPIILRDITGHMLWLNDRAFEYFRITKDDVSPAGGTIEIDETGELWGTLKGNAAGLINISEVNRYSDKDLLNGLIKFQDRLHSYGITSIGLVENYSAHIPFDIYRLAEIKNNLKLKIAYGVNIRPYEIQHKTIYEQLHELKRLRIIYKSRYFDITRACFECDGLIEMHSAFLFKPYRNDNEYNADNIGRFKWDVLEFKEAVKMANRLDFNVAIECRGDNACKVSMDGIEYSQRNNNYNQCRNSIVHLDLITKYYIRRMNILGINAIIHPFWYYESRESAENEYESIGEDRIQRLYPYKSLVENNIVTAASSEYYVEDAPNPIKGIWCAVTRNLYDFRNKTESNENLMIYPKYRLNPDEKVTVLDAVRSFTIDAAYILGKEKEVGSIECGKNADFAVLDKNIFESSIEEISNINVCSTYFDGELVYTNE